MIFQKQMARLARVLKLMIAASLGLGSAACYDSKPAPDNGHYFRMNVALTYKGQPVDIDFVAGCGVHVGRDLSGGSVEEPVSMTAFVFGAKMPEGHAVVIRTVPINADFQPCYGDTTSNGHIPKDWLPLIVWYEHDDDFAHGIGYSTQDAYENPNARFGFRSAKVELATKAEFDAFMRDGPHNLLPSYLTDWLSHLDAPRLASVTDVSEELKQTPSKAWIYSDAPTCRGVQKIVLTPSQRRQVHQIEPADQTGYWAPPDRKMQNTGLDILRDDQRDYRLHLYNAPYTYNNLIKQPKVYPVDASESLARLSSRTAQDGIYVHDVLIGDGKSNLGFMYCDAPSPLEIEEAVTSRPTSLSRRSNSPCQIADYTVPVDGPNCNQGIWIVFWREEFAIIPLNFIID